MENVMFKTLLSNIQTGCFMNNYLKTIPLNLLLKHTLVFLYTFYFACKGGWEWEKRASGREINKILYFSSAGS
jgi:hypothetical protein